ncbi:MAG: ABC transporter ATP-binding protein [Rhizobiaceae bacterium]|nr:ABC transporter ATP-binding protein [Rhizobiaceae bacterium]
MSGQGSAQPVVALEGVTKRFGTVVANRAIDLVVHPGEVLALVGENGAGKSTIVNMLSGLLLPDEGRILVDGEPVALTSPALSVAAGIGVVHQHFTLVPTLSGLDNIALAMPELRFGRLNRKALGIAVDATAKTLGLPFDATTRVEGLDVAQQQRIEIIKALIHKVRLLILDEPTAVLGPDDKAHLFATIRRLKAEGTSVILITHKLEDIFAVADRAVVLRNGAVVANAATCDLTPDEVVLHMVGGGDRVQARAIAAGEERVRATSVARPEIVCSITDMTLRRTNGSVAVSGLTLDLHGGEIVAVAGVDGNGQSELMRVIAGMDMPDGGAVECLGHSSTASGWTAAKLRRAGVAHIPEDRRRSGIVGEMSLARNYLLRHGERPDLVRHGLLRDGALHRLAGERMRLFGVRAPGTDERIDSLSGGNQQKFVLARELDGEPRLILAAHPSRGLDIKTIRFVHRLLEDARDAGKSVLLVSSDLDEILQLADRIVVFAGGRAFGPARRDEISRDEIGAWIAGHASVAA